MEAIISSAQGHFASISAPTTAHRTSRRTQTAPSDGTAAGGDLGSVAELTRTFRGQTQDYASQDAIRRMTSVQACVGFCAARRASSSFLPPAKYWATSRPLGVFARMLTELAHEGQNTETVMIDVEPVVRHWSENRWRGHLKAHRTASSLRGKKGGANALSDAQKAG